MKNLLLALMLLTQHVMPYAQCKDIYGSRVPCPTDQDSLVIYNNALKIMEYYENNKNYELTSSIEVTSDSERREVFEDLRNARRFFFVIRRELKQMDTKYDKFVTNDTKNSKYKDITFSQYYSEVDDYRFYQREIENQIVNTNAPMGIYDSRISPVIVNTYRNNDTSDVYYGDMVNIPLYVPVTVKPFALLTEPELELRNKILHITPKFPAIPKREMVKRDSSNVIIAKTITNGVVKDTIIPKIYKQFSSNRTAIYAFNEWGAGAFIGYMVGRKFEKVKKEQYGQFAVPLFARKLLDNDEELTKFLKIKFGEFYEGLY